MTLWESDIVPVYAAYTFIQLGDSAEITWRGHRESLRIHGVSSGAQHAPFHTPDFCFTNVGAAAFARRMGAWCEPEM